MDLILFVDGSENGLKLGILTMTIDSMIIDDHRIFLSSEIIDFLSDDIDDEKKILNAFQKKKYFSF